MSLQTVNFFLQWKRCKRCNLCKTRRNVVLGRGDLNPDILFIGEAPGKSEDLLAKPFIGPSGKLLKEILKRATQWAGLEETPKIYITNACACRPTDSLLGENRPPTGEELWACYQRLEWECKRVITPPRKVIFLGKVAETAAKGLFPEAICYQHPSYILRSGGVSSPPGVKFIRDLSEVFRELSNDQEGASKATIKTTRRRVIRKV